MWRFQSTHERSETEYLDQAIERLESDVDLVDRAEMLLQAVSHAEPLVTDLFRTPQDVRYHAEGPFVYDHLRQILIALYGIVEDKLHLIDIEEFRRMRGYEGEIEELEETIKEHVGLFEVFALCHDIGKWSSIAFDAPEGSKGAVEGFKLERSHAFSHTSTERLQLMGKYRDLYEVFERKREDVVPRETQAAFYLNHQINIHYPNHGKKIHVPMYEALLERLCITHRLPVREHDLLIDLIAHHMEVISDFSQVRPKRIRTYVRLAQSRGFDPDDYIDLMQGAMLLDAVFGCKRLSAHGYWHDASSIINCLQSEHDSAPDRRRQREAEREEQEKRERNLAFKKVGLGGESLLELLDMEPGPTFGITLRRIQAAVLGRGEMPKLKKSVRQEIEQRATAYYNEVFDKGE